MSYNLKSEEEVKEYLNNLGIEYRFGCYNEKKPDVCHLLGDYLEAIKKDFQKASTVYKNNCDEYNFGKSCYKYGTYCLAGKGGRKEDFPAANNYLEKACNLGETNACFNQGLLLITDNEQKGVPQNIMKGFSLVEKSCMNNNANACYFISGLYISGVKKPDTVKNVDKNPDPSDFKIPKDMSQAFKYSLKGCELGNMYCCANLSQMYNKGEGVEKNEELAAKFKQVALEIQNEVNSQKTLTFQQGLS